VLKSQLITKPALETPMFYAIKCTERAFVNTSSKELNARRWDNTKLEMQIMSELDSPHVIKFVEFINSEPDHFFCV